MVWVDIAGDDQKRVLANEVLTVPAHHVLTPDPLHRRWSGIDRSVGMLAVQLTIESTSGDVPGLPLGERQAIELASLELLELFAVEGRRARDLGEDGHDHVELFGKRPNTDVGVLFIRARPEIGAQELDLLGDLCARSLRRTFFEHLSDQAGQTREPRRIRFAAAADDERGVHHRKLIGDDRVELQAVVEVGDVHRRKRHVLWFARRGRGLTLWLRLLLRVFRCFELGARAPLGTAASHQQRQRA